MTRDCTWTLKQSNPLPRRTSLGGSGKAKCRIQVRCSSRPHVVKTGLMGGRRNGKPSLLVEGISLPVYRDVEQTLSRWSVVRICYPWRSWGMFGSSGGCIISGTVSAERRLRPKQLVPTGREGGRSENRPPTSTVSQRKLGHVIGRGCLPLSARVVCSVSVWVRPYIRQDCTPVPARCAVHGVVS